MTTRTTGWLLLLAAALTPAFGQRMIDDLKRGMTLAQAEDTLERTLAPVDLDAHDREQRAKYEEFQAKEARMRQLDPLLKPLTIPPPQPHDPALTQYRKPRNLCGELWQMTLSFKSGALDSVSLDPPDARANAVRADCVRTSLQETYGAPIVMSTQPVFLLVWRKGDLEISMAVIAGTPSVTYHAVREKGL